MAHMSIFLIHLKRKSNWNWMKLGFKTNLVDKAQQHCCLFKVIHCWRNSNNSHYHEFKYLSPINQLSVVGLLWACTRFFIRLENVLRMYRQLTGNFHAFWDFFLHYGRRYLCNKSSDKMSAICIHFCRLIDCEKSIQFPILAVKCSTKCYLDCILPVQ
jgi:hypothetical protein